MWLSKNSLCSNGEDIYPKLKEYFKKYAYFILEFNNETRDVNIVTYPILKNYEFFKVFNPYETYQQIEMFISNLAINEDRIVMISDKLKAETHGFDKFSFRKDKSK
jgi:coproporphyrinogen III oxidase